MGLSSENIDDAAIPTNDSDFGPWLLVSRRRGSNRGRGSGPRAPHVTHGTAAALSPVVGPSRGSDMRSLRGGRRAAASGRPPPSPVTSPVGDSVVQPPIQCSLVNPTVTSHPPIAPTVVCESQGDNPQSQCALPHIPSILNPTPHISPGMEPSCIQYRSKSPPPVLRSSVQSLPVPPPQPDSNPHSDIVERVSNALDEEDMVEDESQGEESSDEDDDNEMADQILSDTCSEDNMTLYQYQMEARRETLVRKGPSIHSTSPKKGRMEADEPCS